MNEEMNKSLYYLNVFKVHLILGPTKPRKQNSINCTFKLKIDKGGKEIQDTAEVAVIIYLLNVNII